MKFANILILATLLGGSPALAQQSVGKTKANLQRAREIRDERAGRGGQDAERAKPAREKKQGQAAEQGQPARGQAPDQEPQSMKALRAQRRANRPERLITGSRLGVQRAPQARAEEVRQSAQGTEQARRARAGEQRKQVSEFTQLVRAHRVRLAKISRLQDVYRSQDDSAKVERVRALHQREMQNFERVLARSRKQLGTEHFKSVTKRLRLDD